jgi:RHH-type proline utilization regulon transcriptional repressor/proline dehydrogenase/delta 1-pyrroline-5-carboxylate dehydrogenase
MTVRLVKGAYWDSEIKRAQERGLSVFPVFTDKRATDVNYLLAAKHLFEQRDVIFPQFATHNAMTVASVRALAPTGAAFEFQRLQGMGEPLYRVASQADDFPPVRVYAPVGSREDLLAYLIRRILENGANSSFVRQFLDPAIPVATLIENPIDSLRARTQARGTANFGPREDACFEEQHR